MKRAVHEKKSSTVKWVAVSLIVLGIVFFFYLAAISVIVGEGGFRGNTAHIKITGVITSGDGSFLGAETASSEEIVKSIRKAEENARIKAILIDINSPGGSAVASEEISSAIKNSEKVVVALIRDVGTSGAYWAASSADLIVASPLSITGSVGATASYLEFSELMKKYGIGYQRLASGDFKDSGTPFRKLQEQEEELLQEMIELTGNYFAQSVKENRKLSDEVVEGISSGRIYTGKQAKELNLVDELGDIEKAKELIKEAAKVESAELVEYKTKKPFSIASLISQQAAIAGKSAGAALLQRGWGVSLT